MRIKDTEDAVISLRFHGLTAPLLLRGEQAGWASNFTRFFKRSRKEAGSKEHSAHTDAPHNRIACSALVYKHQAGVAQQLHRFLGFFVVVVVLCCFWIKEATENKTQAESDTSLRTTGPHFIPELASIHDNGCFDRACIWRSSSQLVGTMFELVHWDPEQTGGEDRRQTEKRQRGEKPGRGRRSGKSCHILTPQGTHPIPPHPPTLLINYEKTELRRCLERWR